ncbi:MAG TPA: hypothetical protein VLK36_05045 [Gaiellaceae bacterium]|nr:hypothetical protein [Gaiellaceae bacterium]
MVVPLLRLRLRVVGTAALAFVLFHAAPAGAATNPASSNPVAPAVTAPSTTTHTTKQQAIAFLLRDGKVKDWLTRYPPNPVTDATFANGQWTVNVWSGRAGEIATGKVDDATGAVVEAWTGPQVAWRMARGYDGQFGGKKINSPPVWLAFCAVFLIGLVDWRRLWSVRNLDLLVLLSFSVSLWFFNHGNVFAAGPLVYPAFFWLIARCVWVARSDRPPSGASVWPIWVLAAATVFLAGFRVGLNVRDSNVIDVGYSGVIGADRIWHGQSPYGHFPTEGSLKACGPSDSEGEIRDRIQTNGKCETADALGDTYGPVSYLAYIPGYRAFGWTHKWDSRTGWHGLPAVHATSILFDTLALIGLALVGRRLGGPRLAASLAFAWVAWPFSQYASSSNTNDSIMPALLVFGFLALTSDVARGAAVAVSGWSKFASLILVPLWSGYPRALDLRGLLRYAAGFLVATLVVFFVLFLEPSPLHAARVFYDRTVAFQVGRESPFSIWDWRQYHARGIPDLHLVQRVLQVALVVTAIAFARWPRMRSPLRMAALTTVLLIGFEVVLTHWSYLYLPWFFPFVCLALVAPLPGAAVEEEEEVVVDEARPALAAA